MIWRGWGHISCIFLQWIIISSTSSKHCVETTKFQYAYFYLITKELLYIAIILILTEPRWWGNNIDKYTPDQTINIRHTDWKFRRVEFMLQMKYFRYLVSFAPRKWCWNQTHFVIVLSITPWPEHSMSNGTTAHILALEMIRVQQYFTLAHYSRYIIVDDWQYD